ncbi:hypothetical protein PCANC_26989 [Puccinia coronata f. sp. avenae]|uniref:Uncharacterized protein n=1 Tax=Puccinia coronata f. sp. avenae TaxID=200324 RepID=A0A2N5S250_9BASI|nr:hypothetical protein PCANC_26989 [Puccinia coronata f. sp. avenae]
MATLHPPWVSAKKLTPNRSLNQVIGEDFPKGESHTPRHDPWGLIAARPKGVRTPIRTPKKNGVQPLHAASERRAEAARPSPQAAHHLRAGFARLSAHVSLLIQEAYVSRAIGATVYVAPIARLTNPPPSSTTQIRKQMTGHARQTLTRPNHQVPLSHPGPCFGLKGA